MHISFLQTSFLLKRPDMFAFAVDSFIWLIIRAFMSSTVTEKPPVKLDVLKQSLGIDCLLANCKQLFEIQMIKHSKS
ncbi:hypothetical protein DPMN_175670 [Dreissena polymorpha]|uniref:Uncharacterized protein n=1 Tax=Dreissena polymorpha TaxID=45954 RepID=A0A9D4IIZ5_DREPO|nr:hypothetical protein DPMN_175670 [Dreissena polymorpha]